MSRLKLALIAAVAGACSAAAFAQPVNNNCVNATPVSEGDTPFDTFGATTDGVTGCGFAGDPGGSDIWYRYTAGFTGTAIIDVCDADYDSQLNVFSACGGAELACGEDECGVASSVALAVTMGTQYRVRIAGYLGQTGSGTLVISSAGAPDNDTCGDYLFVGPGSTPFSTAGATTDGTSSCGFGVGNGDHDIWFFYSAGINGTARIDTCGSSFDTILSVYSSFHACGEVQIGCNDDGCDAGTSTVNLSITAGEGYIIRVAGKNGASGAGTLTITEGANPANDFCQLATPLVAGVTQTFDTTFANPDGDAPCGQPNVFDSPDVWYRYTTGPVASQVSIATCGSDFNTVVSAQSACGFYFNTGLGCNDNACGLQSRLDLCSVPANTTLRIRVAGFAGAADSGTGQIILTQGPPSAYTPPAVCNPEGETCSQVFPDNYNGGCNSAPVVRQPVSLCTDYCATAGTNLGIGRRDTDWFVYTLPAAGTLTVTGQSRSPLALYIFDTACPAATLAGPIVTGPCSAPFSISYASPVARDVVFFAAPALLAPVDVVCGVDADYYFRGALDTQPCGAACDPDFTCDGNADQDDVGCIINVIAGNPGCECQDPDFNRDGNVDQDDVAALINVVAGGPCP